MERPTQDPVLSYPSPTDLQYLGLGSREVRLRWTVPTKSPQQYRVVYHTAEGQSLKEVSQVSHTLSCTKMFLKLRTLSVSVFLNKDTLQLLKSILFSMNVSI